jgi:peroxiredoxin Q/BCP
MASAPEPGQLAPDFTLDGVADGVRRSFTLSEERGHAVVIAFYPGDDTLTCTKQLCSYQADLGQFTEHGAVVWGISPQGVDSHEKFATRRGLTFPLLADTDKRVFDLYGAKGSIPIRVKRSVFVIDGEGVVRWSHLSQVGLTYQDVGTIAEVLATLG